jgi:hypothetical protein
MVECSPRIYKTLGLTPRFTKQKLKKTLIYFKPSLFIQSDFLSWKNYIKS